MATNEKRPIVIKRIKKVAGGHHGAWKIAYADFVTAMMAFFLLMWLLGSVSKGDLQGISDYFNTPIQVAMFGGHGRGDSSSIIKGGGEDLTRSEGEVKGGDITAEKKILSIKAASEQLMRIERIKEIARLKELKQSIEQAISTNAKLKQFQNQILLDITTEGLRIQIVDEKNRPMFRIGRAELEPYTKEILHEIGKTLNTMPNKVSLSGHTDATPYSADRKGFSNWDLSADRANASRRELIVGGMDEEKVVRVVGLSSAVLFDKENPFNPVNRRISIIVMNKKAEEAAQKDGGSVELDAENTDDMANKLLNASGAASAPVMAPTGVIAAPQVPVPVNQ